MNQNEIKNPMPNGLKKLTLAFDVSTTRTGYAILADDTPVIKANGQPAIGAFDMLKQRENKNGNFVPVEYDAFGDRMTHGSEKALAGIGKEVYTVLTTLTNHYYEMKKQNKDFNIANIYLVLEVSEIPNFSKNNGQTITTTRKLALYTGAVLATVWNMINIAFEPFKDKVQVKLVKPTEWQERLWSKQEAKALDTPKQKGSKLLSMHHANLWLKEMGMSPLDNYERHNDIADAINIALLADKLRDNVFAKKMAVEKKENIRDIIDEINKLSTMITEYKAKALDAKNKFVDNVVWAHNTKRDELSSADKSKHTKYNKYNLDDARAMQPETLLTPHEKRNLQRWENEKFELENKLKSIRGEQVLKCQN